MTVAELIDALSKFPKDMPVVCEGFDGAGYDDVTSLRAVHLVGSGLWPHSHCGRYSDQQESSAENAASSFAAVFINADIREIAG